jgi:hypothetical protein
MAEPGQERAEQYRCERNEAILGPLRVMTGIAAPLCSW